MKLLASLGAFLLSGIINAAPLHNIVIFGDSLSDNGNLYEMMNHQLPQSPPYYEGRFSNGPVWIEYLVSSYFSNGDAHLFNYAVGGSGVGEDDEDDVLLTLKKQVNMYFLSHQDKASPDELYVIWIGANNYLGVPEDTEQTLNEVNTGIFDSVEQLISKGAKHILLLNIPNLGKTPAAVEFGSADMLDYYSLQHNERLFESFNQVKKKHPEVNWLYFDLNVLFTDVIDHPHNYNFTNVTETCSEFVSNELSKKSVLKMASFTRPTINNSACDGYLFFDLVHPTTYAHQLIAERVRELLDNSGIEFAE